MIDLALAAIQLLAILAMFALSAVLLLASMNHERAERRPDYLLCLPNVLEPLSAVERMRP